MSKYKYLKIQRIEKETEVRRILNSLTFIMFLSIILIGFKIENFYQKFSCRYFFYEKQHNS